MTFKLLARDSFGNKIQVDPSNVGSSNVVIENVTCLVSVFVGAVVRMSPGEIAVNALADSVSNSNVIGIVEAKPTTTTCNIRVTGVSLAVFAGLDVTKEYYLSDTVAGQMATVVPTTSGHVKIKIGQPFSSDKMLFSKGEIIKRA